MTTREIHHKAVTGDTDWMDRANCAGVDPDLFFPTRGESTTEARAVCAGCVVRQQCLEYALINNITFGIWGATSERQRNTMRRQRRGAA